MIFYMIFYIIFYKSLAFCLWNTKKSYEKFAFSVNLIILGSVYILIVYYIDMKKLMKKMSLGFLGLFGFLAIGAGTLGVATQANAQVEWGWSNPDLKYNPDVIGSTSMQNDSLITTIKSFVNWVLTILALIALIVLLWGGFQMLTAAGDDGKYKKGFTILKQAAIGLAFIALAWLMVSLIFWLLGLITGSGGGQG